MTVFVWRDKHEKGLIAPTMLAKHPPFSNVALNVGVCYWAISTYVLIAQIDAREIFAHLSRSEDDAIFIQPSNQTKLIRQHKS